jgi:predicted dinucleotide-binding enzyme
MKTFGLIGAGHIGSQLARLAVKSGYDVVISNSRGPQTLADLVGELGPVLHQYSVRCENLHARGAAGSRNDNASSRHRVVRSHTAGP